MFAQNLSGLRLRCVLFTQKDVFARGLFGKSKPLAHPPPALKQLTVPPGIKGHLKYERYWSNNGKLVPQIKQGDTFTRALFGGFKEDYELYPFFFLAATYCVITALTFYFTGKTIEAGNPNSRAWSIIREKYWKYYITLYDIFGVTRARFPLMEKLLDEIEEASEKRRLEDENRQKSIEQYEASEKSKKTSKH